MNPQPFDQWVAEQLDIDREVLEATKVIAAFDLLLSRLEAASDRGAANPLVTISGKRAGGNSRACTRRMLEQLGFTPPQRRAVHRLLAGSTSGWPRPPAALRRWARARRQTAPVRSEAAIRSCPRSPLMC